MKYVTASKSKASDECEKILYALTLTLVFEGIIRKLLPALSTPVFFLKDILCLLCISRITYIGLPNIIAKLKSMWWVLFLLFLPLLLSTAFKDPMLPVFALKQYLLYVVVGIMVAVAFPATREKEFRRFIFFTALLLIPTTIVAILQNALPASHWLNLSVGGESLGAFASAGYLRVGSTFAFTAQYSWFLNAESFFLAASFFLPPDFGPGIIRRNKSVIYLVLALMLIVGAFITGGRTAVLGCGGTLTLGFIFTGIKRPSWLFSKGIAIVLTGIIGLLVLRAVKPEFFSAYEARSSGNVNSTHSQEVTDRIVGGFTSGADWFWDQDIGSLLFGNGLGVMSNGAAQVSSYASAIRATGFWPEGDFPTTVWEGGIYLVVIWYGFRLTLILLCYRIWRRMKSRVLASAVSVPLAYVFIHGVMDPFGMQPPLAIWWWLAIGVVVFIYRLEKFWIASLRSQSRKLEFPLAAKL